MPKTKSKSGGRRPTQEATRSSIGRGGASERPPESAEDFGHVLRRLIVARDEKSKSGVGSER